MTEPTTDPMTDPTSEQFFEGLYARDGDPWRFASAPYERERYRRVVDLLGSRVYERAFEPGCSIGELTAMIAPHCRQLVAIDIAPTAVTRARARCGEFDHVEVANGRLPDDIPAEPFDLLVLSEVGYYFDRPSLVAVLDRLVARTVEGALVVGTHWTGHSCDHLLGGADVHQIITAHPRLEPQIAEQRAGHVLGSWHRR